MRSVAKEMCKLTELAGKNPEDLLSIAKVQKDELPRDLDKLLKGLNIIATGMDFSPLEKILSSDVNVKRWGLILGAVAVKDETIGIFYRYGNSENRIRFTVAHELAHCCLHNEQLAKGHVLMQYDGYFEDEEELRANDFASELLMPEEFIRKDFEKQPRPNIIDLADKYKVPIDVMEVRLLRLKLLGAGAK